MARGDREAIVGNSSIRMGGHLGLGGLVCSAWKQRSYSRKVSQGSAARRCTSAADSRDTRLSRRTNHWSERRVERGERGRRVRQALLHPSPRSTIPQGRATPHTCVLCCPRRTEKHAQATLKVQERHSCQLVTCTRPGKRLLAPFPPSPSAFRCENTSSRIGTSMHSRLQIG